MAAADSGIFSRKACVVVTGASRGLGKSVAKIFATKFPESSLFILLARNLTDLEAVKAEIRENMPTLKVAVKKFDQGNLDQAIFDSLFDTVFEEYGVSPNDFEQSVIVHNAGTLGDNTKYASQLSDVATVQRNFDVNVSGMILLNSGFLRKFSNSSKGRLIVNLSSLVAVQPVSSFSLYCTGKAARDMFFRVMAAEDPSIRVLNYAPGPCETDMQKACREDTVDCTTRDMFQAMHREGNTLDCDTSIAKLVELLRLDQYDSGAHIDFFDDIGGHVAKTSLNQ
ncbi:sepiapterin reductase-like [Mizuhopecten yessoensis]|uniref:Sepiapterin reductase n=1 Tax=Mizuhopecten yessoensis TaxID=6573 RepID=A0A210QGF9_MIZYE|nr:sepiapterin reductase-like [Mizuhopecten yessoensis]OWF47701.1 Sepiapterin reductase [Mizuhopecten yessoensis]